MPRAPANVSRHSCNKLDEFRVDLPPTGGLQLPPEAAPRHPAGLNAWTVMAFNWSIELFPHMAEPTILPRVRVEGTAR